MFMARTSFKKIKPVTPVAKSSSLEVFRLAGTKIESTEDLLENHWQATFLVRLT